MRESGGALPPSRPSGGEFRKFPRATASFSTAGAKMLSSSALSTSYGNKKINFVPASSQFSSVKTETPKITPANLVAYPVMQYYQSNPQSLQPKPSYKTKAGGERFSESTRFDKRKLDNEQSDNLGNKFMKRDNGSKDQTSTHNQANYASFNANNYGYGYGGNYDYSAYNGQPSTDNWRTSATASTTSASPATNSNYNMTLQQQHQYNQSYFNMMYASLQQYGAVPAVTAQANQTQNQYNSTN